MRRPVRLLLYALVLFASFCSYAADPPYYVRTPTWHETLRLSRDGLAKARDASRPGLAITLSAWKYCGSFSSPSPFTDAFPPEQRISLDTSYGGKRWITRHEWVDGVIQDLGPDTMCAHYLFRTLTTPRDTMVTVSLGSDDGINVWMNGTKLISRDESRAAAADQEILTVALKKGDNAFLMKVNNGYGPSGFYFALYDNDLRELMGLVRRDFPDEASVREMAWEEADTIWSGPWIPGDMQALALKYAAHAPCTTKDEQDALTARAAAVTSAEELTAVRTHYVNSRVSELVPIILTPKPPATPRINGARRVGARPGSPFLHIVPVTGDRPMKISASGLPRGLALDGATGIITGTAKNAGTYHVRVTATNARGTARSTLTIVIGKTIALTPPLGWNSWNCFATAVDDGRIRAAAEAMVAAGLTQHGWSYINIDDCWEIKPGSTDPLVSGEPRKPDGTINTNKKFPDMHALSTYVHAKGLKLGIYSSPGPLTCGGYTASYQHELLDAKQYGAWGIDYLKYDWCSYGQIAPNTSLPELKRPYTVMRAALDSVRRDIVYSLCQYGMGKVWEWGATVGGNCWRTTGDITDTWESMAGIGFSQGGQEAFAGPGRWNDPDMLVVGKVGWGPALHPTRLTPNEQYTHISLWCLLASPLLIGCDMTQMDDFTLSLLTNDEVLAVNQDPLGKQAGRIATEGDTEVWAKKMEDGSYAVGLFNRGRWQQDVTVLWSELGLKKGSHAVRDLWRQKDLGAFDGGFTSTIAKHGVVLIRVTQ